MTAARITARGWGYRYPGRSHPALAEVSFDVQPSGLVVLMGASGSGKSTLMAALAGTLPEEGASGTLAVTRGEHSAGPPVGLVQQEPESNVVMEQVGDDVAFPMESAAIPRERIWPRVSSILRDLRLDVPLTRRTDRLSGGQQQLLALSAAIAADPGLLLLDEPTANLDPTAASDVVDAVAAARARTGSTVVVIEHRVEPWLATADLILLAVGGTVEAVSPGRLAARLAERPVVAGHVWLGHDHLPSRPPASSPGEVVLEAVDVAVDGRLSPVHLAVRAGEVVALTGPPGSGKSTLLACLAGLLEPTAGSVRVGLGELPARDPWRWPSTRVAETFGVVFQDPEHQFLTGRVRDELAHGLDVAGVPGDEAGDRVDAMLGRLHLEHLQQADPFTLSGGEQRRLSVGTAVILDPPVLLLDEPTFGQDPATWAEVVDIIAFHRDEGRAVVMATHDPLLVRALAAREVRLGGQGGTDPGTPRGPGVAAVPEAGAGSPPPAAGLRRLDPLALVGASALLSAAALVSTSVLANVLLAAVAVLAALAGGVGARRVGAIIVPAAVAAMSVGLSNALLSEAGVGSVAAWEAAALPATRILAVALPGLVAAVSLDPTSLADSLVVRLRVPARAAYSALAALRLLPLLGAEWTVLGRASRARGVGGDGPVQRARQFVSMTFRLLVAALRRGSRLAVALDVRGLRSDQPRTVARPLRWGAGDTLALVVGIAALVGGVLTRI